MENTTPENCQLCLRPFGEPGVPQKTQWISICRCDRPYSPNSSFSIEVCATCKRRVASGTAPTKYECAEVCLCQTPDAKKLPTQINKGETDSVVLDLASIGMSSETFPDERYAPIAILGTSSRATTILCRDRTRGMKVAVKCFKKIPPALHQTFDSEARKNKQLSHTLIAKIVDSGIHNGKTPYLVTEYKDGFNIEQCLALHGVPSYNIAIKVMIEICEAILYAQSQSLLHRDVRPGNVIFMDDLNSEPTVVVTDFALPKIRQAEELTDPIDATWMSSDVARNMEYTEKSEVYSIGYVGYALLTGRPGFRDGTTGDIKNAHALKLPPKISDLKFDNKRPRELEEIIYKCIEKDPAVRFDSVQSLCDRLKVFPQREQMHIAAIHAAKRRAKLIRFGLIGLGMAALGVLGFLTYGH